jgi:hypothetical protein
MKYADEMGSGAMIYIYIYTKFHKDWLKHSKVDRGIRGYTDKKEIT